MSGALHSTVKCGVVHMGSAGDWVMPWVKLCVMLVDNAAAGPLTTDTLHEIHLVVVQT